MSEEAPYCAPPRDSIGRVHLKVPAGSCDTHVHVFGPAGRYPYQPTRAYTPHDCTPERLLRLHRALGVERAVLVQASVHGTDNSVVLDTLSLSPDRFRAVVSVGPDTGQADLEAMHAKGVRGIRVNLVDKGGMAFDGPDAVIAMSERVAAMGWHVEFLVKIDQFEDFPGLARKLATPVVVGHFGYMAAEKTVHAPAYRHFLDLVQTGKCWVKLTGPYRISSEEEPPYSDVAPFAQKLVEVAPERLLWGSDWPHVMMKKTMPDDAELLDALSEWIPDENLRRLILSSNPVELYDFPEASSKSYT